MQRRQKQLLRKKVQLITVMVDFLSRKIVMRKKPSSLLVALGLIAVLAGCAHDQAATKKAKDYNAKVSTADIVFVDNPKFYENLKGSQSGSIYISGIELTRSLEKDLTAFGRRIGADLPPKVASDIIGKVSVLTPAEFSRVPHANSKVLVIRPIAAKTTCKPCYSVVTFQVEIFDADWSRHAPTWATETKLVVSKSDSVEALWSKISDALRADDLLPATASKETAAQ
ncbi:MAG: hypothetical protein HYU59_09105 [Magnetospirillum gryphiswaldense]|nr:hypothetical protein [Magnetospirillum gryphiswaldense]